MNLFDLLPEEDALRAKANRAAHKATLDLERSALAERPHQRQVKAMFASVEDWRPPELPDLSRFDEIIIDLESTGLRWWDEDRLIGAGIWTPDGITRYLPVRHQVGPNIDKDRFFDWCRRELRHKRIVNIRTKFDLHLFRRDDIDLEAQGCTFGDVAHYAALLDDHRRLFNQEDLALAYLAGPGILTVEECKVKAAYGYDLDPKRFATYPAGLVAPRAEGDVRVVQLLQQAMWLQLDQQNLHEVRKIEDAIIPVVVEMEHNGAPIDVELLHQYLTDSARDLDALRYAVKKGTGIEFEKFTNNAAKIKLFHSQHIDIPLDPEEPHHPETGAPHLSFADALLKPIQNKWIQALRAGLQLESLRSKFLLKYERSVARDGILRYELHQMPYQDDDEIGGGGAVSGRFSSAAPSRDEGANIQQVFGVEVQKKGRPFTRKYLVKRLFKTADPQAQYVNADASQLQFRIFAHYANDSKIIKAYDRDHDWRAIEARAAQKLARGEALTKDDKLTDFHDSVGDLVLQFAQMVLTRTHTKNVNFAQVFGAGVPKMAMQLNVPREQIPSYDEWTEACREHRQHEVGGPKFQEAVQLSETYHTMFPSVKPLLALTSHLAMPGHRGGVGDGGYVGHRGAHGCGWACRAFYEQGYEHRGWVRTWLGRRARFERGGRFYSALNRIIQGTEADIIKRILIEVHARRHELGLIERFTVHDALAGDLHGDPQALKEVLNTQYYTFRVPILWSVGVGTTWADAK